MKNLCGMNSEFISVQYEIRSGGLSLRPQLESSLFNLLTLDVFLCKLFIRLWDVCPEQGYGGFFIQTKNGDGRTKGKPIAQYVLIYKLQGSFKPTTYSALH